MGFPLPALRALCVGKAVKWSPSLLPAWIRCQKISAVQTMLPAFYEQGYDPIMMESQFSPQLVAEHLGVLKRRNIDGVVLFGFTGITEEMLAHWQSSLVLLAA